MKKNHLILTFFITALLLQACAVPKQTISTDRRFQNPTTSNEAFKNETKENKGKGIDPQPQITMIIWPTGSLGPVKQSDLNLNVFSYEIRSLAAHIKSVNYKPHTNKTPEIVSFSNIRSPDFRKYPLAVQFKFDKYFYFGDSQIQTFVFLLNDQEILEILYPKNEKEWYKLSDTEYGLWFKKLYELRIVIPYALDDA